MQLLVIMKNYHALDTKNAGIMQNPNPLNLTFCDVKKFDLQIPVLGKIAT